MALTKFRKDHKDCKNWTIYVWEEGDLIRGAAKIFTIDGVNEIFISGRQIVEDKEWKNPNKKKDIFIAKSQVKIELQNTLNAFNWYGKKIMGNKGIDEDKFMNEELKAGVTASGIHVDISKMYPVQKFPVKNITHDKAKEFGLI